MYLGQHRPKNLLPGEERMTSQDQERTRIIRTGEHRAADSAAAAWERSNDGIRARAKSSAPERIKRAEQAIESERRIIAEAQVRLAHAFDALEQARQDSAL